MVRRIYHKKTSSFRKLPKYVLVAALIVVCGWGISKVRFGFNPDRLVENSMLQNQGFSTNVEEIVSREGIKAYYFEDHTNPIISISFLFKNAGGAFEERGQFGIANMTAALLTEGAGELDSRAFKDKLEENAIVMSFGADDDHFSGHLKTLKQNQRLAFSLLKTALTDPRFDRSEVRKVKKQLLLSLKQQRELPDSVLDLAWSAEIFGVHPYARNPIGRQVDIENLNADDLRRFVREHLNREDLIVGVAGDISRDDVKKMLDQVFGSLPEKGGQAFVGETASDFSPREINRKWPTVQNMATFTGKGVSREHPDFYPLYLANQIFAGQGLTSRVSLAAREDKGLTYGVYSYLLLKDKASLIKGGFSATPENFGKVRDIVTSEWVKMGREGVSAEELAQAKNYLIASYNLRFADLDTISAILVAMQEENLGIDFLEKRNAYVGAVTLDEVNAAAAKYFVPEGPVWVNLGTFNEFQGEG